jgi:hypothetical protein
MKRQSILVLVVVFSVAVVGVCEFAFADFAGQSGSIVACGENDWGQLNNVPAGGDFVATSCDYYWNLALMTMPQNEREFLQLNYVPRH